MIKYALLPTNSIFQNTIHLLENMLYDVSRSSSPQLGMMHEAIQKTFNYFCQPLYKKSLLFYNFETVQDNSAEDVIQRLADDRAVEAREDVFTYNLSDSLDLYDLADLLIYETTLLIKSPITLSYPNNI